MALRDHLQRPGAYAALTGMDKESLRRIANVTPGVKNEESAAFALSWIQSEGVDANLLRYATQLGPVGDPRLMDWRDAVRRLRAVTVRRDLGPVLASVLPGGHLVVVSPVFRDYRAWEAPWTRLVYLTSQVWTRAIAADPRFRAEQTVTTDEILLERNFWKPLQAVVYVRRR